MEPGLHIFKALLADDDVAAYQQRDALEACLIAFFPHAPAVQFSLPVQGGDHNGVGFGFNGGGDILLLGDHHAQVDDVKPGFCKSLVQNAVAHGVHVSTDDAHDQHFLFSFHGYPLQIMLLAGGYNGDGIGTGEYSVMQDYYVFTEVLYPVFPRLSRP